MNRQLNIVVVGLSLSSSWGNGHATTYRSLLRGLHGNGHDVLFLERDVPWYADHRDLATPDFCRLEYYRSLEELDAFLPEISGADAVIIGSFVPEGRAVIERIRAMNPSLLGFYDIDTPVTVARLEAGEEDYLARHQVPYFDLYLSFAGGRMLELLENRYGAKRSEALFCSVDSGLYIPTGEDMRWDLGYLGTYSPDRQPALEQLLIEPARRLPEKRFAVAGPQYPADIDWPTNVERIDHLPPSAHASFYSRCRFTLNITRADMVAAGFSPSVRIFEAAACATPIISDRWPGLDVLLPESEAIFIADATDDVVRVLTEIPEEIRRGVAENARARVLASHTAAARAGELTSYIETLNKPPVRGECAPRQHAPEIRSEGQPQ
ncbi:CgeB family protein [Chelativorans salis]|uniref:Glycosyltransferase n=1 Tax=Chelativorans salis TaxID=2978478 RepID=A0ABT2LSB2_9HYPH|nr:glycosyltransferase [Chelativorans sp. EGI FJ00035]MCT7377417.1 glycosyltransferase [Chelativorans sp. EGI FJ00035]